jgi:hypothetical protein
LWSAAVRLLSFARADVIFVDVQSFPSPRVQTIADGMPEASIAGQKADLEDVARTRGRARGHTAEEAAGRPATRLFTADRPDEEPMILERNQASPRLEHPRIAIANISLAAQLSNNRRFDVDITPYR